MAHKQNQYLADVRDINFVLFEQ
ncbi:MAG: acyl-CoA dehydrogenase N-terminal domain-containing protein, partial [Deltaproteobacteria bacterium]|nr:acyl-CoA dehydrogenase N-terminal domain-containing protein [Deltaproteobacteria bacterium]